MSRKLSVLSLLMCVACIALGACSSSSQTQSQPELKAASMTEYFSQYLQHDLTDFEREVINRSIKNGSISASDYEQAHDRYVACMTGLGYTILDTKTANGVYTDELVENAEIQARQDHDEDRPRCMEDYDELYFMYRTQQGNPHLYANQYEAIASCLRDVQVVPADYTAQEAEADINDVLADDLPRSGAKLYGNDDAYACLISSSVSMDYNKWMHK